MVTQFRFSRINSCLNSALLLLLALLSGCQTARQELSSVTANRPLAPLLSKFPKQDDEASSAASVVHVQHTEPKATSEPPQELPPDAASPRKLDAGADLQVSTLSQTYPIDLPTALRLGNGNNLQIALARERIEAGIATLEGADALWLPHLSAGTQYMFHTGQIQRAFGEIGDQQRNSLFVGGGPTLGFDLADALYEPLIAQRRLQAECAAAEAATNDTLLKVSDAYLDLLAAHAGMEVARETQTNARELARLTAEFTRQGVGLRSDAERAETELGSREQQFVLSQERVTLGSTSLAQLLRLDPQLQLVPLESHVVALDLISDQSSLGELVAHALSNRPELAEHQALIGAAVQQLRQATYAPLIPSVLLGYQAGGFGGGPGAFFGSFADRGDLTAAAVWELRNLGFGDRALRRVRESQLNQAQIRSLQVADRVASEVVVAHQMVVSRRKQISLAQKTVEAAVRSYELNMTRIRRGGGLPIEVLQSIQALDRSRGEYLQAVTSYNKAQFRLLTALGNVPYAPFSETAHTDSE